MLGNDMKKHMQFAQWCPGEMEAVAETKDQVITVHFPVIADWHTDAGVPVHAYVTGKLTWQRCTKHYITASVRIWGFGICKELMWGQYFYFCDYKIMDWNMGFFLKYFR